MEGICKKMGVESITERNQMLEIIFGENANIDGGKLFKCAYEVNRMFTFEYKAKKIIMRLRVVDNSWINDVIKIIENYINDVNSNSHIHNRFNCFYIYYICCIY